MFNAVGGSTITYAAHFPRFHPSDFRVRTLDGVADDWPLDYATARAVLRAERAHDGRRGSRGRSRLSPEAAPAAARAAGAARRDGGARLRPARLALVAVGQRDRDAALRGPRALHEPRPLSSRAARRARRPAPTSPTGPWRMRRGVELAHRLPRARDPAARGRAGGRRRLLRRGRRGAQAARRDRGARVQRHRDAAAAAQLALEAVSRRAREPQRPGRAQPDVPSLRDGDRGLRGPPRRLPRAPPAAA